MAGGSENSKIHQENQSGGSSGTSEQITLKIQLHQRTPHPNAETLAQPRSLLSTHIAKNWTLPKCPPTEDGQRKRGTFAQWETAQLFKKMKFAGKQVELGKKNHTE